MSTQKAPRRSTAKKPAAERTGVRERSAQATRDNILKAAIKIFARHGFAGGRVEQISRAARSYDRMIYYYFGSKEQLYVEVLEEVYRRMDVAERALDLDVGRPREALVEVVRFVWNYYRKNPELISLLNNENLLKGKHITKSERAQEYSSPAIAILDRILASGVAQGIFRAELNARDLYIMIASLGYFYLSNRHTLSAFLGEDMEHADALAHWERFITDSVLRVVCEGEVVASSGGIGALETAQV